jgi:type II secretory pathway pseudopilin PulG
LQLVNDKPPEPSPQPPRERLGWLRREGIDLGDAVVQFFAVVVGIVLGLFISQWSSYRHQQQAVHEAMRAIRAEAVANRASLRENAAYLYKAAATIAKDPANQNQPPRACYQWSNWQGTGSANLTDAAYQTAIATQTLSYMPFEQAQQVAKVYGAQHNRKEGLSLLHDKLLLTGEHALGFCVAVLNSLAKNERLLDAAYTPLIGPDKVKWPEPLVKGIMSPPPHSSKRGTS